jgi:hypothetical protein
MSDRAVRIASIVVVSMFWCETVAADYRVVRSALLTEPGPLVTSYPLAPRIAVTEMGHCVAWFDRRQGGALLAARIDASGRVLDPFGIPVAVVESPGLVVVIGAPGGCVVGWNVGTTLEAVFIRSLDERPRPEPAFTVTIPAGVPWVGFDRLLYFDRTPAPGGGTGIVDRLHMIDAAGREIAARDLPLFGNESLVSVREDDEGLVLISRAASGSTPVWRIYRMSEALELTLLGERASIEGGANVRLFVGRDGDALIGARVDRVDDYTLDVEWERFDLSGAPLGSGAFRLPGVGMAHGFVRGEASGRLQVDTLDGRTLLIPLRNPEALRIVDSSSLTRAPDGSSAIWVSRGLQENTNVRGLIFEYGEPDGIGAALTNVHSSQVLTGGASDGTRVVLTWREDRSGTFHVGVVADDHGTLGARLSIDAGSAQGVPVEPAVAVAIRGDVLLVAWTQARSVHDMALRFRRATLQGEWIDDEPLTLYDGGGWVLLNADGLTPSSAENGFAIVYSHSGQLFGATIGVDGRIGLLDRPLASGTWSAIIREIPGGGFAVAKAGGGGTCTFLCEPISEIQAVVATHAFDVTDTLLEPKKTSSGYGELALATDERAILLALDIVLIRFRRDGSEWHREAPVKLQSGRRKGIGTAGGRFVITAHRGSKSWGNQAIQSDVVIGEAGPGRPSNPTVLDDVVSDWSFPSSSDTFVSRVFEVSGRILLFTSVVTDNPEEGLVRRVRMHEIERASGRRRPVTMGGLVGENVGELVSGRNSVSIELNSAEDDDAGVLRFLQWSTSLQIREANGEKESRNVTQ